MRAMRVSVALAGVLAGFPAVAEDWGSHTVSWYGSQAARPDSLMRYGLGKGTLHLSTSYSGGQATPFSRDYHSADPRSEVFTLGYTWRNVSFESSAHSMRELEPAQEPGAYVYRRDATSRRLSYSPAPNWVLHLSRGHLSNLDQLESNREIRRTAVAATYIHAISEGDWQTTLAWGRNSGMHRESMNGYLLESTLRLKGAHAFFSRVEQVGSDDLLRENEALRRQMFKLNKLTVGYFYDVRTTGNIRFDIGGLVSRHQVPAGMASSYGADPTAFMMFVRFKV
jgi:hypothetical protein